ncbi:hypothetical protein B296_00043997 [Ensete ventricosum]|uniref:Uncharacterized protein n=1 Tax=Ensete ventricosum TaxID=4639 RepID=A0A426XN24_ENSVE|nr:hypothetical protein B296_00043997 [Ensete ventricosum]
MDMRSHIEMWHVRARAEVRRSSNYRRLRRTCSRWSPADPRSVRRGLWSASRAALAVKGVGVTCSIKSLHVRPSDLFLRT